MSWYCDIAQGHPVHGAYHDREYGFPATDRAVLFERLCLEIFQAGLSWEIILKKRAGFYQAFRGWDPAVVARFDQADTDRLLTDAGIVRNRLKVKAVIDNAARVLALEGGHESFSAWIAHQHADITAAGSLTPEAAKAVWVKRFKKTFAFMGGEVVGEFLMSIGYLPGAHRDDCPVFTEIAKSNPPWSTIEWL